MRELILLGIVLAIGIGLRAFALSHSAVEHFDEGVYASNLFFGPPDYAYPQQRFYAPPLLPGLIETAMIVGLPPNVAALMPGFLAGCGTIVGLWWLGRSWFSPRVGIAAAALAALSPYHIAYSAAALTDVLLGLWLVLAVDAIARSLHNGDLRWATGAGLFTGLAWWTKYNGWLPLAVEAIALPLLWLVARWHGYGLRSDPRQTGGWLASFALTAIVATGVWSPYYFSLRSTGGYAPIAANHAKYVVGFAGWPDAAARQVASFELLGRGGSGIVLAVALWLAAAAETSPSGPTRAMAKGLRQRIVPLLAAGLGLAVLVPLATGLLSLVALSLASLIFGPKFESGTGAMDAARGRAAFGNTLLCVWWGGLLVATPCYWPYPRLLLPWLLAAWLGVAMLFDEMLSTWDRLEDPFSAEGARSSRRRWWLLSFVVGAIAVAAPLGWLCRPRAERAGAASVDRLGLLRLARELRADLDRAAPPPADLNSDHAWRAVYVMGEPALLFQLSGGGEPIVVPVQTVVTAGATLQGRPLPTFLVVGPHARRDPQFSEPWQLAARQWKLVGTYDYAPSLIVWLDLDDPRSGDGHGNYDIRLYEFQP